MEKILVYFLVIKLLIGKPMVYLVYLVYFLVGPAITYHSRVEVTLQNSSPQWTLSGNREIRILGKPWMLNVEQHGTIHGKHMHLIKHAILSWTSKNLIRTYDMM